MTAKPSPTLHQQILGDIETRIVSGEWPPGFRLPFEVELAKSYNVSRMTVNKVLTQLASAGLIERRKKSGSFVAQPQVQSAVLELHDIEAEVRSLNRDYRFAVLSQRLRRASDEDLTGLALGENTTLLEIECVHFAADAPFCHEYRLINLDVVPKAREADFAGTAPGKWLRMEVPWSAAEHRIRAVSADKQMAGTLSLSRHAACLVVERRTWHDGKAVTFVRFTYPGEQHALIARFTPASA
ncbi:histidine utilization repressor [Rhizobium paknamense]|uniref:Histidine utilization repressor n=1 Tax=Rhizobium paknamense TaxID=1206817 RepID=A0ABU0IDN1_9HYPH|nr:histidine utilization repressor [Rhizobium paknamense]MDQ0456358.1 GntR family histidine utilization transcriptional repressor [Rhizobium paknamense]